MGWTDASTDPRWADADEMVGLLMHHTQRLRIEHFLERRPDVIAGRDPRGSAVST